MIIRRFTMSYPSPGIRYQLPNGAIPRAISPKIPCPGESHYASLDIWYEEPNSARDDLHRVELVIIGNGDEVPVGKYIGSVPFNPDFGFHYDLHVYARFDGLI